jgi:cobaltochelatase CobS
MSGEPNQRIITMNWQNYKVGTTVTVNGAEWKIVEVEVKRTSAGYQSRLFSLRGPNGETVVKTSRGLTYWLSGGDNSNGVGDGSGSEANVEAEGRETNSNLAASIAQAVQEYLSLDGNGKGGVDEDKVRELVREQVAALSPRRVEVVNLDGRANDVGVQHAYFDALLRIVACRLNCWLVGPAGSGKTSAVKFVSDALGLPFFGKSVGPQTSESSLLGYYDANGRYVRTQLRDCFEKGGVFVLDEVDAGNPAVLVTINSLLANGHAQFPDGIVEKHKDFVLIACANTIGQGADQQYVGRQQVDAATLDRFVFLQWPYDVAVEAAALGVPLDCFEGLERPEPFKFLSTAAAENVEERVREYVTKVTAIRKSLKTLGKGVRHIVGPRANFSGVALVRVGWKVRDVLDACVWKGCAADTRSKIEAGC